MTSSFSEKVRLLTLRARMKRPNFVRQAYRFALAFKARPHSHELTQAQVAGRRFYASRYEMLAHFPKRGRVAELGCLYGQYSRAILEKNDPAELHLIDLDLSNLARGVANDGRVSLHGGSTVSEIERFPDHYFDWIYIDADHAYAAVLADAYAAAPKLRPGGFLVFNDFTHNDLALGQYGVHRAAAEFAAATNWSLACFAYSVDALYDIALQKPHGEMVGAAARPEPETFELSS